MKPTKCEMDQIIEATRIWFHNNPGKIKIKECKVISWEQNKIPDMPEDFKDVNIKDFINKNK